MIDQPGHWPRTIPEAARRAAEAWPDAPALIVGAQSWTFRPRTHLASQITMPR
jgi:hypothetical protein